MAISLSIKPQLFRWSVDRYHRLVEAGILDSSDQVELLDGQIVNRSPSKSRHAAFIKYLNRFFSEQLGPEYLVGVQDPVRLNEYSEPEPDIAILRFRPDYFANQHPVPEDVVLVIEVADSSLEKDRELKSILYAKAGIPEYWVVNLLENNLEQFTRPSGEGYESHFIHSPEGQLESEQLGSFPIVDLWLN